MTTPKTLYELRSLRALTEARIGLKRMGASLSTEEVLRFDLDHARARDAVHLPFEATSLMAGLEGLGLSPVDVHSAAMDRGEYLRRPDLGRRLDDPSRERLQGLAGDYDVAPDVALVVADGLSTRAIHDNALPFLEVLLPLLRAKGWRLAPVAVATQARVALGDDVGAALGARLAVMLIGERPGLTAADSLGIYLTHGPRAGRVDAERNCISNVRAAGLDYAQAAALLVRLMGQALVRGLSGVDLKDDRSLLEAEKGDSPRALE